jgi:hypothetical protein
MLVFNWFSFTTRLVIEFTSNNVSTSACAHTAKEVIEANNRWQKHLRARGLTPRMSMMERYSDAKASVPALIRFSILMWAGLKGINPSFSDSKRLIADVGSFSVMFMFMYWCRRGVVMFLRIRLQFVTALSSILGDKLKLNQVRRTS